MKPYGRKHEPPGWSKPINGAVWCSSVLQTEVKRSAASVAAGRIKTENNGSVVWRLTQLMDINQPSSDFLNRSLSGCLKTDSRKSPVDIRGKQKRSQSINIPQKLQSNLTKFVTQTDAGVQAADSLNENKRQQTTRTMKLSSRTPAELMSCKDKR